MYRISRSNWVFQLADFRRVLMLPLDFVGAQEAERKAPDYGDTF
jgi:hypothetical protein